MIARAIAYALVSTLMSASVGAALGRTEPMSAVGPCDGQQTDETRSQSILVDGVQRTYEIHIPPRARGQRLALVFAFHGRGETPDQLAHYSGLSRLADLVVYPRGLPGRGGKLSWSGTPTAAPGVDDVRFVRTLLAKLERSECVDSARIHATGKSDGGGLAAQLACSAADRFIAVAPVAGAYYPTPSSCHPVRPVSVLEFHGDADRVIPYTGSARRRLPDIRDWLVAWAARDGCAAISRSRRVAPSISQRVWAQCAGGVTVAGYLIRAGGHTWPGATRRSGPGMTTPAIDATTTIDRFFRAAGSNGNR